MNKQTREDERMSDRLLSAIWVYTYAILLVAFDLLRWLEGIFAARAKSIP